MHSKNKEETLTHRVFGSKVLSNGKGGGHEWSSLCGLSLQYYSAEYLKDLGSLIKKSTLTLMPLSLSPPSTFYRRKSSRNQAIELTDGGSDSPV